MSETSFCGHVKADLEKLAPKKKCCKITFEEAISAFDGMDPLGRVYDNLRCENCIREFLRASFIKCGKVTDPEREYHLEFSLKRNDDCGVIALALRDAGFDPGESTRGENFVLYFKDSETVEDILAYIGATKYSFDVMNSKIMKEMRNNTNRAVNCDTANIAKTLGASGRCIAAIEKLRAHGVLDSLPAELREAAKLRVQNVNMPLSELAARACPPVTKSGMNHRLNKLIGAADDLKEDGE